MGTVVGIVERTVVATVTSEITVVGSPSIVVGISIVEIMVVGTSMVVCTVETTVVGIVVGTVVGRVVV